MMPPSAHRARLPATAPHMSRCWPVRPSATSNVRSTSNSDAWTIKQAIGYLYSTSLPLRRLLGARRTAFEETLTTALLSIDPTGQFTEPVALEVLTATRD